MVKETVVCTIIILVIIIGNVVTQNYTKCFVKNLNEKLDGVKVEIENLAEDKSKKDKKSEIDSELVMNEDNKEIDDEETKKKIDNINKEWESNKGNLAYYIEHDEMEKVEKSLVALKTNAKMEEYEQAMADLEDVKFVLKHIQDKYAFTLQNIF